MSPPPLAVGLIMIGFIHVGRELRMVPAIGIQLLLPEGFKVRLGQLKVGIVRIRSTRQEPILVRFFDDHVSI